MKNNILYSIAILIALLIGFGFAWIIKPAGSDQHMHKESTVKNGEEQIYTCSMHPQIRQNEPGICPICEMDLIPVDENASNDPLVLTMTKEAIKLSNIQTSTVGQKASNSGGKEITMTGRVKADESTASSLVSHVPGRIEKLYISYTGEKVQAGQKLADVYSPDLISAQQELLEAKKLNDINPGLIEAAKLKLKNWKISDKMISDILEKKMITEVFTFYAEHSGFVSNKRVAIGDYVKQGEALFDIISLNSVWVVFDAYEEDLGNINVGDRISFKAAALGDREFNTRVTFIDPIVDPNTRTTAIRTEISNKNGLLKPEMFVTGSHIQKLKTSGEQIMVPASAVMWTGKRSVVYIKKESAEIPSFEFREVVLGEKLGSYYKVLEGIKVGEEVVTNGAFVIDAAAQLNNQASMMNKSVLVKGETASAMIPDYKSSTPEAFKSQLNQLVKTYLLVKDAMVQTNPDEGGKAAEQLLERLSKVDMTLLSEGAHEYWMEKKMAIQAHGKKIINDSDIEEQRQNFEFLSEAMIDAIQAFGGNEIPLYVQFCPMAFNNQGASWISSAEEIQNPYFGDKMMKCGVTQSILLSEEVDFAKQRSEESR